MGGVLPLLPKATAKSPYQPTPDIPPLQRFPWGGIPTPPRRDEMCDLPEELPSPPGSNLASPYSRKTLPSDSLLCQKARRNLIRRLRRNSKPCHSSRLWMVFQCQWSMAMWCMKHQRNFPHCQKAILSRHAELQLLFHLRRRERNFPNLYVKITRDARGATYAL